MELASGSLRDILSNQGQLEPDPAVSILIEIGTGLEHLGRHAIIHRGLSAEPGS